MSKPELTKRVGFDFIRYANCWEDADLLVKAIAVKPGEKVLSIASGGDNSFALLAQGAELIVGVDVNQVQLHLCELKKAAYQLDTHQDFLEFLGFKKSENRIQIWQKIRKLLPENSRLWWDAHTDLIAVGVIHSGKFECYFYFFRNHILPLIHSKKRIAELLVSKTESAQHEYYHKNWNTWRWRLLFHVFFSRFIMGRFGRDPEFMNEVKVDVGSTIFNKTENHLQQSFAQHNLYLHCILTGHFAPQLPFYARSENFDAIRQRLDRIQFVQGYAEDACNAYGQFDGFNLSNIFEYLPLDSCKKVSQKLIEHSTKGARFAYWNLMVPRNLASYHPDYLQHDSALSNQLTNQDSGFFYRCFQLDIRKQ